MSPQQIKRAVEGMRQSILDLETAVQEAKEERDELIELIKRLREFVKETHDFRQDPEEELSEMPFGVIDYYGMEALIDLCDKAIAGARIPTMEEVEKKQSGEPPRGDTTSPQ